MDTDRILSLDIETSSSDLDGVLLSIGLVKLATGENFYRQAKFRNGLFIKPESMKVNSITIDQLDDKNLPTLEEMDKEIAQWLGEGKYIAMGRGIGYFDMKFIHRDLPITSSHLERRVFDLTGFIFGIAQSTGRSFYDIRKDGFDYMSRKTHEKLPNLSQHHALWDAWSNVYALEYLTLLVKI